MSRPRVLFVHELAVIGRAVQRVLACRGFDVDSVLSAAAAAARLRQGPIDALVLDVALPDDPGLALIDVARDAGARAVILVAAVYRKTSYKRRPTRLYGADDYVEIHHLGDLLPLRLRAHLDLEAGPASDRAAKPQAVGLVKILEQQGDEYLDVGTGEHLAQVLVADLLLDNADAFSVEDIGGVRRRIEGQLETVLDRFARLRPGTSNAAALIDGALSELLDQPSASDATLAAAP